MGQIQDKKQRIQILLALLVIGGVFWYAKFGTSTSSRYAPTPQELKVAGDPVPYPLPILVEGPSPDSFETFTLPAAGAASRDVVCGDTLYTVLVFPAGVDYRRNPRGFVYNSATPCAKGEKIVAGVAKESLQAAAGEYYLVVADQGASGSWYNPR
jgi:hypothetical protein